ncbi:hypothetical protein HK104_006251 [Borealophlyctis nickersoniae]|nr:hypothetical protein HK104_006251 [Borealophlyctis nickersoniae]
MDGLGGGGGAGSAAGGSNGVDRRNGVDAGKNGIGNGIKADGSVGCDRKDTLAIKRQLAGMLGGKGETYWAKFREFMAGKCVKAEFDRVAAGLGAKTVKIHNSLILAILHNVQPEVPSPSGVPDRGFTLAPADTSGQKRKAEDPLLSNDAKKPYRVRQILSLEQQERARLFALGEQLKSNPPAPQPLQPPLFRNPPAYYAQDSIPRTCVEEKDLPSRDALTQRMKFLSALEGLDESVPDDSVELMYQAIQNFMKNTITCIQSKIRPFEREDRETTPPPANTIQPPSATSSLPAGFTSFSSPPRAKPASTRLASSSPVKSATAQKNILLSKTVSPPKPEAKTNGVYTNGYAHTSRTGAGSMSNGSVSSPGLNGFQNAEDSVSTKFQSRYEKPNASIQTSPSKPSRLPSHLPPPPRRTTPPPQMRRYISLDDTCFATDVAAYLVSRTAGGLAIKEKAVAGLGMFDEDDDVDMEREMQAANSGIGSMKGKGVQKGKGKVGEGRK